MSKSRLWRRNLYISVHFKENSLLKKKIFYIYFVEKRNLQLSRIYLKARCIEDRFQSLSNDTTTICALYICPPSFPTELFPYGEYNISHHVTKLLLDSAYLFCIAAISKMTSNKGIMGNNVLPGLVLILLKVCFIHFISSENVLRVASLRCDMPYVLLLLQDVSLIDISSVNQRCITS